MKKEVGEETHCWDGEYRTEICQIIYDCQLVGKDFSHKEMFERINNLKKHGGYREPPMESVDLDGMGMDMAEIKEWREIRMQARFEIGANLMHEDMGKIDRLIAEIKRLQAENEGLM